LLCEPLKGEESVWGVGSPLQGGEIAFRVPPPPWGGRTGEGEIIFQIFLYICKSSFILPVVGRGVDRALAGSHNCIPCFVRELLAIY